MKSFKTFKLDPIREAVKLTPGQLDKPNSSTGEDRIDILARLIQDKKSLELANGGTFTVTEIEDALKQIDATRAKPRSSRKNVSAQRLAKCSHDP